MVPRFAVREVRVVAAAQAKIPGKAAAFYDVDGTLLRTNVIHAYAYYAVNLPTLALRKPSTASSSTTSSTRTTRGSRRTGSGYWAKSSSKRC
jgi:hypothetical protein